MNRTYRNRIAAVAALFAAALLAQPARAQSVEPDPDQLVLKYTAQAGSHAITGTSHQLEWNVVALAGGSAKVQLRIPVASFESGQATTDAEMSKALDAERFPFIEVEGIAQVGAQPVRFTGVVRLHGRAQPFTALLSVDRSGAQLAVSTSLSIDLDAFGVERPQLAGSRIERKIDIDFAVLLSLNLQAVVSGGFVNPKAVEEN